tara:strand:- start:252 stop:542 length:291 start_codon:yes stop_codon:yes gene_type:complete
MKISLSNLPSPDRVKAEKIGLCSAPEYQFFQGKLIRVRAVMSSEKSDRKYQAVIFQDPAEFFCDCADFTYRKNFCKHLSKLYLLTNEKETFSNAKN